MLPIADIRRLSRIQPGRAQLRALFEWLCVVALVLLQERLPLYTLPLTLLLIASRQHAMLVLMHDAAHYRASNTRFWNELFGEALAWPLLVSMRGYRRHHTQHHVADTLNTPDDPDFARKMRRAPERWTFPMPKARLAMLLLRDVMLLNTHEYVQEAQDAGNVKRRKGGSTAYGLLRLGFVLALVTTLTLAHGWRVYLLYWLLPTLTFLKAILRIRSIADHFATDPLRTRTILPPWWERLLIAPANISVHGPHHAQASIPYYRLREAHALMHPRDYAEAPSYWHTLLREMTA